MSCRLCDTEIRHGERFDTSDEGDVHVPDCPPVCRVCRDRVDAADLNDDGVCVDCPEPECTCNGGDLPLFDHHRMCDLREGVPA